MIRTIYKYEIRVQDESTVILPRGYRLLSVMAEKQRLYVWAAVTPTAESVDVRFSVRGTGHPMSGDEGTFLGTVKMEPDLIWHIFYRD